MRHNSADNAGDQLEHEDEIMEPLENNYENFAHELSHSYWSPMMTNTRDLSSNYNVDSKRLVQVDLNSTNSDSNKKCPWYKQSQAYPA